MAPRALLIASPLAAPFLCAAAFSSSNPLPSRRARRGPALSPARRRGARPPPPASDPPPRRRSDLSASSSSPDADDVGPAAPPPLPFFATASFADQIASPPPTQSSASAAAVTTRLPLGTLFSSRDYVFATATNVRGYEWTVRETDALFDDLTDAALGNLTHMTDYELHQIVLVPMEWDREALGLGGRYDVYDGQQRLVTVCLLLAALREAFRSDPGGGCDDAAREIADMLNPPKARKGTVLRIELRRRDGDALRRILLPLLVESPSSPGAAPRIDLPPPEERGGLSAANRRVLENYERLSDRVASDLTAGERVRLLDYLVEHVHFLVCVPETGRIARNIVLAQGRRGMDNEPIDDFKGLVCFRYTLDEDDMYRTFDRWDDLASEPAEDDESSAPPPSDGAAAGPPRSAAGTAGGSAAIAPVGRDTVADACVLRASSALRTKIRRRGGDEASALERWLREDLIRHPGHQGRDFFEREVAPSSVALRKFRDLDLGSLGFLSRGDGDEQCADRAARDSIAIRLRFLRGLTSAAREAEMAVLGLLRRADGAPPMDVGVLDGCLRGAELAALWMAVTRPSLTERHRRVFAMLDAIESGDVDAVAMAAASREDRSALRNGLVSFEFGAAPGGKRVASALLERINSHLLVRSGMPVLDVGGDGGGAPWQRVEHVLPAKPRGEYWDETWPDEEDRDRWTHRLGNLALLARRATAREANKSFEEKKGRYDGEVWPLTRGLSKVGVWDAGALMEQQRECIALIEKVWGL